MNTQERVSKIEEAKEMVEEAKQMVEEAIRGTGLEPHYEAYGEYGFNQLLNEGNPYDMGLDDLIESLEEEEEEPKRPKRKGKRT